MQSSLMKNLPKKDAVQLLDNAFQSIRGRTQADLESVIQKLRNLVPFDKVFAVHTSIVRKRTGVDLAPEPRFTGWTFGVPAEWLKEYQRQKILFSSP